MPTVHGDYPFTVTVTDSAGTMASGDFSLHVLGGDRWVAWVGDTRVDGSNDVVVAGLPALAATAPVVINPIIAGGSASTSVFLTQFSPDGTKIAFRGNFRVNALNELFLVDLSGNSAGTAEVVNPPPVALGGVVDFVWSPDSTRILYSADQDVDELIELYLVDVSGPSPWTPVKISGLMITNGDISPRDFNFSPDGSKVVFLADAITDARNELFYVDVGGAVPGAPIRLNNPLPASANIQPLWDWTPDGQRIIYAGDQDQLNINEIFIVDLSGATPTAPVQVNAQMVANAAVGLAETDVTISADGTRVAYVADQDVNGVEEVYVVDISGPVPGAAVKVSGPAQSFTDNINVRWSPVALKLVYASDQQTSLSYEVYLVDLTSGVPAPASKIHAAFPTFGRVASGVDAVAWSNDGTKVAYRADTSVDEAFEVEVVDVSSPIPAAPIDAMPPRTPGLSADAFEFALDSSGIAARGEGVVDNRDELFVTRFSGPNANVPVSVTGVPPAIGGQVGEFLWVDDSRQVWVRGDLYSDGLFEAYLIDTTAPVIPPLPLSSGIPANGDVSTLIVRPH
jgi:Tol biopolymer transport system component